MTRAAISTSRYAAALLCGPLRHGTAIGHGYVLVGDDVLAVTPPGAPRMPNGLEADLELAVGSEILIGEGALRMRTQSITPGPGWDARPAPRVSLSIRPRPHIDVDGLVGRGPGLTPLGDDIVIGYLAARALAGESPFAGRVTGRTTTLAGTLIGLASLGELPEEAHALLEDGDPEPLLRFGTTSGRGIAVGLAAGSPAGAAGPARGRFTVSLPFPDGTSRFEIQMQDRPC